MGKYNLSFEERFLDLLGYEYLDDTPGKWRILDDKKNDVGYIEANINPDKNDNPYNKRGDYIYHMVIDSDTVHYDNEREFDEQIYFFDVKVDGKIEYDVFMQLGEKHFLGCDNEFLTIYNKEALSDYNARKCIRLLKNFDSGEHGIINGHIKGVGAEWCYPINGYKVDEEMWFRNKEFNVSEELGEINLYKYYEYRLIHHPEGVDFSEGEGYELSAFSMVDRPGELFTDKMIIEKLSERKRKEQELNGEDENGNKKNKLHLFKQKRKVCFPPREKWPTNATTPEEFAIEHGRGIEVFKQAIKIANQILPFKKDIIYDYYKDYIDEYNLGILFDEYEKENTK